MIYGATHLATDWTPETRRQRVLRALLFFVPRSNPDFEVLFPLVDRWLLEVNDEGAVVREVALASDGRPLFGAPFRSNLGFWPDSPKSFVEDELEACTAEEFRKSWEDAMRVLKK